MLEFYTARDKKSVNFKKKLCDENEEYDRKSSKLHNLEQIEEA